MKPAESRYVENKAYLARAAREGMVALRDTWAREATEFSQQNEWYRCVKEDFPKYVPFLTKQCGLEFRGRILEIGAGGAWLSAEISKLPRVVEVIATDASPGLLKEHAPKVFKLLAAHSDKITRMPTDFHHLDFPNNHFDFVVCSAVLHRAANIVQVLREAKRVLKPGGQLVAIREPVWPLVRIKSRARMLAKLVATGVDERFYTLSDYREFFKQAALPLHVKRINLARGFKYYVNKLVNGLTHARYAFIGTKRGRA
jgi:ubiquinone/menaquinone biosynthesis C-methylase UbiE